MHPALEKKLQKDFKLLFCNYKNKLINCQDGWYDILRDLFTNIEEILVNNRAKPGSLIFVDIKEKLGGLRCNIYGGESPWIEEIWKWIEDAEERSFTICEICGKPGSLRTDLSNMKTLCDEHYFVRKPI